MRTLTLLVAAVLVLAPTACAVDETFTNADGSSTWPEGAAGLSGAKVGTNAASVSVTTTHTVNAGNTAVVQYRIGVMVGANFTEIATYSRNLTAGAGQVVSNTFSNMSRGTQYTVKVKMTFGDNLSFNHTDRMITVNP